MTQYNSICKICGKDFGKTGSLHKHLKSHDYYVADYYVEFYGRKNKFTGDLLPFKDIESYFNKDFSNRIQMNKWLNSVSEEEGRNYIQSVIMDRVKEKKREYLPFHLELENCFLPKMDMVKQKFGSYSSFSKTVGTDPLFDKNIVDGFFDKTLPSDLEIAIDTREQKPLSFDCGHRSHKLSFGDYTLFGDNYNYTFVDRKSATDFCGTMVGENLERFKREVKLAANMDAYIFVVIESSVSKIIKMQKKFKRKASIDYILKNMRDISYEFPRRCQFVFAEDRKFSQFLIPRILYFGQDVWRTDLQYFIDKKKEQN